MRFVGGSRIVCLVPSTRGRVRRSGLHHLASLNLFFDFFLDILKAPQHLFISTTKNEISITPSTCNSHSVCALIVTKASPLPFSPSVLLSHLGPAGFPFQLWISWSFQLVVSYARSVHMITFVSLALTFVIHF